MARKRKTSTSDGQPVELHEEALDSAAAGANADIAAKRRHDGARTIKDGASNTFLVGESSSHG